MKIRTKHEYTYYNIYNPEFNIEDDGDEGHVLVSEFYAYEMNNSTTMFQMLSI